MLKVGHYPRVGYCITLKTGIEVNMDETGKILIDTIIESFRVFRVIHVNPETNRYSHGTCDRCWEAMRKLKPEEKKVVLKSLNGEISEDWQVQ